MAECYHLRLPFSNPSQTQPHTGVAGNASSKPTPARRAGVGLL
ncbi:hypothetical protein [Leptolyngbya sp. 'hensonii']|nr:hypothetical protein [Leptolyngbya sp. 'hensonii']